jgi:hypothetical protein
MEQDSLRTLKAYWKNWGKHEFALLTSLPILANEYFDYLSQLS